MNMMNIKWLKKILCGCVAIVFLLSGCSLSVKCYSGPKLSNSEIAKIFPFAYVYDIDIYSVDEIFYESSPLVRSPCIHVLPGQHELSVRCEYPVEEKGILNLKLWEYYWRETVTLRVNVHAGHSYWVVFDKKGEKEERPHLYVIDTTAFSGQVSTIWTILDESPNVTCKLIIKKREKFPKFTGLIRLWPSRL